MINQHLFSSVTRVYAILDGAAFPDLLLKFYETNPPRVCLFTGELEADTAQVAPYLVRLYPRTPFTDWIIKEFWNKNGGVFIHSRRDLQEMRRHFRSLTTVYDERGEPMTFRFYDPRVLRKFLPTCNKGELKIFFGDVESFFVESEDRSKLLNLRLLGENDLQQTAFNLKEL